MSNKPHDLILNVNGVMIACQYVEQGVYRGGLEICGTNFHVEAVMMESDGDPKNLNFQNRIDRFCESNDGERPQLVTVNGERYFVHLEPFAE